MRECHVRLGRQDQNTELVRDKMIQLVEQGMPRISALISEILNNYITPDQMQLIVTKPEQDSHYPS